MILRQLRPLLLAGLIVTAALGQYRREPPKGPRAIGVIEWDAKGVARLVPVSIMIEGKWYDADLYQATPVPMALDPETVYEATKEGEPAGLFTISNVGQVGRNWFAVGKWHEGIEPPKTEAKPKPKAPEEQDERPILHKPGSQPKTETPPAQPAPASKPEATKPQEQPAPKPAQTRTDDEDVNRPVLRRGKPEQEQAATLPDLAAPPAGSPAAPATKPQKVLVAVSDAKHNEYRPFTWNTNAAERQQLTKRVSDLAAKELNAFASSHPGPKPGALQDVDVRAFDLELSNEPVVVLTARAPEGPPSAPARTRAAAQTPPVPSGLEFYVTVVARQDYNGDLHKLFSVTSDSRHLDAYPRLELIDAVDADGNSRGDLLFRQITDQGRSFIIYRVDADRLAEIFEGGAPLH